jgi:hypothetical protein
MIFARIIDPLRQRLRAAVRIDAGALWLRGYEVITTFILVTIAWVFFRADSFRAALAMFGSLGRGMGADVRALIYTHKVLNVIGFFNGIELTDWAVIVLSIAILFGVDWMQYRMSVNEWLVRKNVFFRWGIYFSIVYFILFLGKFGAQQFIYFQF